MLKCHTKLTLDIVQEVFYCCFSDKLFWNWQVKILSHSRRNSKYEICSWDFSSWCYVESFFFIYCFIARNIHTHSPKHQGLSVALWVMMVLWHHFYWHLLNMQVLRFYLWPESNFMSRPVLNLLAGCFDACQYLKIIH